MSWDFDLKDPVTKETLKTDAKHHIAGSIITVGGSDSMDIQITYNYSKIINPCFNKALKELGINSTEDGGYAYWMHGKSGAETINVLKKCIEDLGDDVDDDYWKATEGNAKRALCGLLAFAQMRPDGIWSVC